MVHEEVPMWAAAKQSWQAQADDARGYLAAAGILGAVMGAGREEQESEAGAETIVAVRETKDAVEEMGPPPQPCRIPGCRLRAHLL